MLLTDLAFALSAEAQKWIFEGIGILASAFVLVSFLMSDTRKIRLINIIGAVIFVVYGILIGAYATSVMNFALIIVHVVKLVKERRKQGGEGDGKSDENGSSNDVAQADVQSQLDGGSSDKGNG